MTSTPRLSVGDSAPEFTLTSTEGAVTLADLRSQSAKGVILYFYPAASTPGCTTQACDFRDSLGSLTTAGYVVVGISPDAMDDLHKFCDEQSLSFALASDPNHAVTEVYGAWGEKTNYGRTYEGLLRSTVVISPAGEVVLAQYNVKAAGHVARLRRELGLDALDHDPLDDARLVAAQGARGHRGHTSAAHRNRTWDAPAPMTAT